MAASNAFSRIASFQFGHFPNQGIFSSSSSFILSPLLDWKRDESGRVLLTTKHTARTGRTTFEAKLIIANEVYREAAIRELEIGGKKKKDEVVCLTSHVDHLSVALAPGSFVDDSLTILVGDLLPSPNGTVSITMTSTELTASDKHLREVRDILDEIKLSVKPVVDGVDLPTMCVDFSPIDTPLCTQFLLPLPTAPTAPDQEAGKLEERTAERWKIPTSTTTLPLHIGNCCTLAFTQNGNIVYTAYTKGTHIIRPDGSYIRAIGTAGAGPGQYKRSHGVCVSKDGLIYVTDDILHRVSVFNETGDLQMTFGKHGFGPGEFSHPYGICISEHTGLIYVAGYENSAILKFRPAGEFVGTVGQGHLNGPCGIGLDREDNLYVAEYSGHRVSVFRSDGTLLRVFGSQGSNVGQLFNPHYLRVDVNSGLLFVADFGNKRLQVFRLDGAFENTYVPPAAGATIGVTTNAEGLLAIAVNPGHIVLCKE